MFVKYKINLTFVLVFDDKSYVQYEVEIDIEFAFGLNR